MIILMEQLYLQFHQLSFNLSSFISLYLKEHLQLNPNELITNSLAYELNQVVFLYIHMVHLMLKLNMLQIVFYEKSYLYLQIIIKLLHFLINYHKNYLLRLKVLQIPLLYNIRLYYLF